MKRLLLSWFAYGVPLLLLGGCDVGSDEGQPPGGISSSQSNSQAVPATQTLKSAPTAVATASASTDTYYLKLFAVNAAGDRVSDAVLFEKSVPRQGDGVVQLVWFEPVRKADGSCLRELSGYALQYGLQSETYSVSMAFDLASPALACTSVGTTECGDVRECRYQTTL
ncbi:MAG: hypothetical protein GC149_03470 [Gammaproteobacteria bacterium]|nr:hypothetical protein [Gammaproteobacteria bacterium]